MRTLTLHALEAPRGGVTREATRDRIERHGPNPPELSLGTESIQTRSWREMDSNFRFRCDNGSIRRFHFAPELIATDGSSR